MKSKKALIFTLCSTVLLSSTILTTANASASSNTNNFEKSYDRDTLIHDGIKLVPSELEKVMSELDKVMANENISEQELIDYGNFVKEEVSEEVTQQWKGAVVKKAVKYMVDHSDIIPSKAVRDVVDKYGNKIISAIDTAETYTWYGIATALTKVGVPDKYADLIADFIVKFLL